MIIPVIGLVVVWLTFHNLTLPEVTARAQPSPDRSPLSESFWILAILVALGIGIEFCPIYFGAELLVHSEHLSTTAAGAALSLSYAGLLVGRVIGSRLTRSPGRAASLVLLSLAAVTAGVTVFWLVPVIVPALIGLFVTGFGVANLYPLSAALALATAPGHADIARARATPRGIHIADRPPYSGRASRRRRSPECVRGRTTADRLVVGGSQSGVGEPPIVARRRKRTSWDEPDLPPPTPHGVTTSCWSFGRRTSGASRATHPRSPEGQARGPAGPGARPSPGPRRATWRSRSRSRARRRYQAGVQPRRPPAAA
jgi:hypothetical protein